MATLRAKIASNAAVERESRLLASSERAIAAITRQHFMRERVAIRAVFAKLQASDLGVALAAALVFEYEDKKEACTFDEMIASNAPKKVRVEIDRVLNTAKQSLTYNLEAAFENTAKRTARSTSANFGFEFQGYPEATKKWLKSYTPKLVDQLSQTSLRRILGQVVRGQIEGESVEEIRARVERTTASFVRSRPAFIARTESKIISARASADTIDSLGYAKSDLRKKWSTSKDDDVRDSHRKLEGVEIPGDQRFANGLLYPGEANGPPAEIINCRCVLLWRVVKNAKIAPPQKPPNPTLPTPPLPPAVKPTALTELESIDGYGETFDAVTSEAEINSVDMFHYTDAAKAESIEREGFRSSSNSVFGKGVYFTDGELTNYGDTKFIVSLKQHTQLAIKDEADVARLLAKISGKDIAYVGSEELQETMVKKGVGSLRFKVDEQTYTVVLDPKLIKISERVLVAPPPGATLTEFAQRAKALVAAHIDTDAQAIELGKLVEEEHAVRFAKAQATTLKEIAKLRAANEVLDQEGMTLYEARKKALDTFYENEEQKTARQRMITEIDIRVKDLDKLRYGNYDKIHALEAAQETAHKEALREVLREVREYGTEKFVLAPVAVDRILLKRVNAAAEYMPSAWVRDSNSMQTEMRIAKSDRGFYSPTDGTLSLSNREGVVEHELGHRMEHANYEIVRIERQFYTRRTKTDKLEWLGPGYEKDEQTRKDKWIDPYMGKEYGTAFELLSMGHEAMWDKRYFDYVKKDSEFVRFILGLMAGI
jgi:Phage Mu protein F like protein